MLTLLEAAKLVQDPLKRGVIELFPRTSPVLLRLPFFNINGQAYRYNVEETMPGIAFRGINESYSADTGVVNPATEPLFILGGLSRTDRALVKTQGNINNLRSIYDGMKAKAAALTFTDRFFNGDNSSDPNEFDGLKVRLTGDQAIKVNSELSLTALDYVIDQVQGSPDVLFMNKTCRRKVSQLVRASGQATEVVNDAFGRQLAAYAGIPIAVIEENASGEEILGFTEEDDTTSIFAVRFGLAEYVSGLQAGSMDVLDQGLNGTYYQTLIEWICGLGVFHPKAAARIYGIQDN